MPSTDKQFGSKLIRPFLFEIIGQINFTASTLPTHSSYFKTSHKINFTSRNYQSSNNFFEPIIESTKSPHLINQSHQPASKMSSQTVTSTYPSTTTRPSFETSKSLSTSTSSTSSTSSLVDASGQMKSENLAKKAWKAVVKHAKEHHRSVNAAYAVYYGQGQGQTSGVRRE